MKVKFSPLMIVASITILLAIAYSYYSIESFNNQAGSPNCGDKFCDSKFQQICSDKVSPDAVKHFGLTCLIPSGGQGLIGQSKRCADISKCTKSKEECEKQQCPIGEFCNPKSRYCEIMFRTGEKKNLKYVPVTYTKCGKSLLCDTSKLEVCDGQYAGYYNGLLREKYGKSQCYRQEKVLRKTCTKDSDCKYNEECYKSKCSGDLVKYLVRKGGHLEINNFIPQHVEQALSIKFVPV